MSPEAHVRVLKRMARVDAMPRELRECVHDFGLTVVEAFLQAGVKKAKHIRHIVNIVHAGSVEIGDRRSAPSLIHRADIKRVIPTPSLSGRAR